ncbi:MAG: hypothetical protein R3Y49_02240 [Rikenellaceae bacterium]
MRRLIENKDLGLNLDSALNRAILPSLRRLFGVNKINALYEKCDTQTGAHNFIKSLLGELHVNINRRGESLEDSLGSDGAVIVVANYSQGILDALILLDSLLDVRSDVKILVPRFLEKVEPLKELFIFSGVNATRQIVRHLNAGGVIVNFPSIGVLHPKTELLGTHFPNWDRGIFKIAEHLCVPILPIVVYKTNSSPYFLLKRLEPALANTRLLLELLNKHSSEQLLLVGRAIQSHNATPNQLAELSRISLAFSYLDAADFDTFESLRSEELAPTELKISQKDALKEVNRSESFYTLYFKYPEKKPFLVVFDAISSAPLYSVTLCNLLESANLFGEEGCDYYDIFEISHKLPPEKANILELGEFVSHSEDFKSVAAQRQLMAAVLDVFSASEESYLLTLSTVSNEQSTKVRNILADYTLKNYLDKRTSRYVLPRVSVKHAISNVIASRLSHRIVNTRKYFLYFMHDTESSNEVFTTDFKLKVRLSGKVLGLGLHPTTLKPTSLILINKGDF